MSSSAVSPVAAAAAAFATAAASPRVPWSAFSAPEARKGVAAAPVTATAALVTDPSFARVTTAATPTMANPDAGCGKAA